MQIILDQDQINEIRTLVIDAVKSGIQQNASARPYVTRRDIAKYFGVADSTITKWASLGMPVSVVDGRKLYGKKSITQWLKEHETTTQAPSQHAKHKKSLSLMR